MRKFKGFLRRQMNFCGAILGWILALAYIGENCEVDSTQGVIALMIIVCAVTTPVANAFRWVLHRDFIPWLHKVTYCERKGGETPKKK